MHGRHRPPGSGRGRLGGKVPPKTATTAWAERSRYTSSPWSQRETGQAPQVVKCIRGTADLFSTGTPRAHHGLVACFRGTIPQPGSGDLRLLALSGVFILSTRSLGRASILGCETFLSVAPRPMLTCPLFPSQASSRSGTLSSAGSVPPIQRIPLWVGV